MVHVSTVGGGELLHVAESCRELSHSVHVGSGREEEGRGEKTQGLCRALHAPLHLTLTLCAAGQSPAAAVEALSSTRW